MKTVRIGTLITSLLVFSVGFVHPIEIESLESYRLIDRLLSLSGPGAPEILDDMVLFTASSSHRRVGVAFADEGFSRVHWFRQLLVRSDIQEVPKNEKKPSPHGDSGIIFYIHEIPEGASRIDYRLVIDGLWTTDPANPNSRWDSVAGLSYSTLAIPKIRENPSPLNGPPDSLSFVFKGPPGETVSVAGSFNGWDPFMYELKEGPAGNYSINIPLPPGKYQYVFFHRGERWLDPYNSNRVFSKDGKIASEIEIR
jgi:hypothetical protein